MTLNQSLIKTKTTNNGPPSKQGYYNSSIRTKRQNIMKMCYHKSSIMQQRVQNRSRKYNPRDATNCKQNNKPNYPPNYRIPESGNPASQHIQSSKNLYSCWNTNNHSYRSKENCSLQIQPNHKHMMSSNNASQTNNSPHSKN